MDPVIAKIKAMGGTLEQRGWLEGYPYFAIESPANGPVMPTRTPR